jgi:transcriptional regulator of PTS gene
MRLVCLDTNRGLCAERSLPLELSSDPAQHTSEIVSGIAKGVAGMVPDGSPPLIQVGVTLPGVTDADQGIWVRGFQVSGIRHVSIRDLLSERVGVPVLIEDPARAAAFREMRQGNGLGSKSLVLLYLDYGVGSGIVLGRRLYRGRDGLSGEVGHLVVDPRGYRCSCGDVGCLETVASTGGILRRVRDRLAEGVVSSLSAVYERDAAGLSLEDVLRAADDGDRLAQAALSEVGECIGSACATLVKIINPECLIVSGVGAMFARYFEPGIRMMLERHVIPEMLDELSLRFCAHRHEDEAHGAALMALDRYWSQKVAEVGGRTESPDGLGP